MESFLRSLRRRFARCAVHRRRERLSRTRLALVRAQGDGSNSTILSYDSFR